MPLAGFVVGNRQTLRRADEVLSHVIVPRALDDAASVFLKLGARRYLVISIAMAAAVVQVNTAGRVATARVAVGSCSVKAQRLTMLEDALVGTDARCGLSAIVKREHLAPLSPIDDVRGTAEYRMDSSLTLVRRALDECAKKC
jgi:CO/xanthine dehydrogenase FAD-binding subunit